MKVWRIKKKEVEVPEIGDKIKVKFMEQKQTATCMGLTAEGKPVFLFDNILMDLPHDEAEAFCEEHGWFLPTKQNLEEWPLMQDYHYRIAGRKESKLSDWWWLADPAGATCFAAVYYGGLCLDSSASGSLGVRPAFLII